jgi:2-polyprenyl-3-methyl-5-hydroxy-6-metoxy-1,4-benzoquinol methylase
MTGHEYKFEQPNQRIESAYQHIKQIYKQKGWLHSFYNFYRHWTCPIKKIFQLIPEGKHYVDIGCGYGFISLWTALAFPDAKVTGMDAIEARITFADEMAKDIPNLSFMVKDVRKDSIDEAEMMLLIDLFHHVPFENQMSFLKQCIDKTPKDGYIIFKDIDRKPWWKFRVNFIQDYLFTRERTYCRDKDEYMEFFKENGCQPEYFDLKKGYPYSHYLIKARKLESNSRF